MQNVGGHQHRVAEESVGRQVLVGEVLLHLLVAGHALQPAQRRAHAQKQRQLGVLQHAALQKQHALCRVEPGRQVVQHHLDRIGRDLAGVGVVRGQRVPVGDEEVAIVLVLQLDPVGQRAHVVAQVQFSRGAHAAEHARALRSNCGFGHDAVDSLRRPKKTAPSLKKERLKNLIPL